MAAQITIAGTEVALLAAYRPGDHVALTLALECQGAGAGGLAIGPMSGRKE